MQKKTNNGLLKGRDDDFGMYLSRKIVEQERQKNGGSKAAKKPATTKKGK